VRFGKDAGVTRRTLASISSTLTDLLQEILQHSPTPEQPLRAQGLDSMSATRLWLELCTTFGVDLTLLWLATEASPQQIAHALLERQSDAPPSEGARLQVTAEAAQKDQPFPLTPIQEAYLLGSQPELTADPVGCDQYVEFEVHELDVTRLHQAWQRLTDHHDMLRWELLADGQQRIRDRVEILPFPIHDLRGHSQEAAHDALLVVRDALLERRADALDRAPVDIELSLLPGDAAVVHLGVDLLITDGHGLAVLLQQWHACYHDPSWQLPAASAGPRDCVLALAARAHTETYRADLAWWAQTLEALPPGPQLGAMPTPAAATATTAPTAAAQTATTAPDAPDASDTPDAPDARAHRSLWGALDLVESAGLRAAARGCEVSPSALVLAVLARAIGRCFGDHDFALVVTTNSRAALPAETEHVVGPFTSTALVAARGPLRPLAESAPDLQRQLLGALAHSSVSGVTAARAARSHAAQPRPLSVVFTSLLGVGPQGRQDLGFGAAQRCALCRTSEVALELQLWEDAGALRYRWDLASAAFASGAAEAMFAAFENALERPAWARARSRAVSSASCSRRTTWPGPASRPRRGTAVRSIARSRWPSSRTTRWSGASWRPCAPTRRCARC
jgi:acyl carrier protein